MDDSQKTTLWLGALRYYMGRTTYAVNDFCNLLIQEWSTLDEKTKNLIQRDLQDEINADDECRRRDITKTAFYKRLGHDCDRESWDLLMAHIKKTKEKLNEVE